MHGIWWRFADVRQRVYRTYTTRFRTRFKWLRSDLFDVLAGVGTGG